jgi:small acid-soluble spore protein H (minor)
MDVNRAQEILKSTDRIDVQLNGEAVWIDSVDTENHVAQVHAEHNPSERKTVSVDNLQEV